MVYLLLKRDDQHDQLFLAGVVLDAGRNRSITQFISILKFVQTI